MPSANKHNKIIRLPKYTYQSDGYYFVTMVCSYRSPLFFDRKNQVETSIRDTMQNIPGIRIDTMIIMDNHVHMILHFQQAQITLGQAVRRLKGRVTHDLKLEQQIWQPNYYEHIIRNDSALGMIREYILQNPEKERLSFERLDKKKYT